MFNCFSKVRKKQLVLAFWAFQITTSTWQPTHTQKKKKDPDPLFPNPQSTMKKTFFNAYCGCMQL